MYTVYIVNKEPVGEVFPHIEPKTNHEERIFWIGIHPGKDLKPTSDWIIQNEKSK